MAPIKNKLVQGVYRELLSDLLEYPVDSRREMMWDMTECYAEDFDLSAGEKAGLHEMILERSERF
jgi:hypothetical protein